MVFCLYKSPIIFVSWPPFLLQGLCFKQSSASSNFVLFLFKSSDCIYGQLPLISGYSHSYLQFLLVFRILRHHISIYLFNIFSLFLLKVISVSCFHGDLHIFTFTHYIKHFFCFTPDINISDLSLKYLYLLSFLGYSVFIVLGVMKSTLI